MACNKKEHDTHWASNDKEWVGRASMGSKHKFLLLKSLDWRWFNGLVVGLVGGQEGQKESLDLMLRAKQAAQHYVTHSRLGWSGQVGFFLHICPFNSIQSFHLHLVDLTEVGPTYDSMVWKNLPIDALITVLYQDLAGSELSVALPSRSQSDPSGEDGSEAKYCLC